MTTQAPSILPSLVPIGPAVSEENIKIQKVNSGRTDDGRPVVANASKEMTKIKMLDNVFLIYYS